MEGPKAVAGNNSPSAGANTGGSSSGTGGSDAGGTGSAMLPEGVPLTATDGWVAADSNALGVQGAMFAYADDTSKMGMTEDFLAANACIKGTAAKVDLMCTFVAPATDCYGQFWGAAIGLNLNQPTVMMDGMEVGGDPIAFDASALTGFAFEISGAAVPLSLRFKVEDASGEFCSPATKKVAPGANTFLFEDLVSECWEMNAATMNPNAATAKSGIIKIAWQVVTNAMGAVPFDYCVSNVRALQ